MWRTATDVTDPKQLKAAYDLWPIEPFAVFMPMIQTMLGETSFGADIKTTDSVSFAGKMAAGLVGFLAPPIVQKYGFKLENPGGAIIPMSDVLSNNGGQMTLPKGVTATMGGLLATTLTALGGTKIGLGGAGLATAAGAAGMLGGMAGYEMNTRRLMTDLGLSEHPNETVLDSKGDWTLDFFANTFLGVNKSWKGSAGNAEFQMALRQQRFEEQRSVAKRSYIDALRNGRDSQAMQMIKIIRDSFVKQWTVPGSEESGTARGHNEFLNWMERTTKELSKNPQFRSLSEDQILFRMRALRGQSGEMTRMNQARAAELRAELDMRRMGKARDLKIRVTE
jgi:hypothetical protein